MLYKIFRHRLKHYELEILNYLLESCNINNKKKLQDQINAINLIQRLDENQDVCFYRMKSGRPTFNKSYQLDLQSNDIKVATIRFENTTDLLTVGVWITDGYLFNLRFNNPPKTFFKSEYHVVEKKIIDLNNLGIIENDEEIMERLFKDIPDRIKSVLELESSYKVSLNEGDFFLIFNDEGDYLGMDRRGSVFGIFHDSDEVDKLFESKEDFLKALDSNEFNIYNYFKKKRSNTFK